VLLDYKLPRAFGILAAVSGIVPHDWCAVLLHDGDDLDSVAFLFRPGRRPRSDLGADHVFVVDHRAVVDIAGLVVVGIAAEEVHADAVALLHHRLPLIARRAKAARRAAADGDDASVGTRPSAGSGEDTRENSSKARFEGRQAGAYDADVDFEVAPERCHRVVPA